MEGKLTPMHYIAHLYYTNDKIRSQQIVRKWPDMTSADQEIYLDIAMREFNVWRKEQLSQPLKKRKGTMQVVHKNI